MNGIVLAVILLSACFLMHFLMMRKSGHCGRHENDMKDRGKEEKEKKHSGGCH